MTETSLEELVQERQFAGILQTHGEVFFRLSNTLLGLGKRTWNKKHYFQLISEADSLESFLDDYGARYNRTYSLLTELVASLRWFAHAGYSLSHHLGRIESYGAPRWLSSEDFGQALQDMANAQKLVHRTLVKALDALLNEARRLGVEITPESFPENNFLPVVARRRLPRNVGQSEPVAEEQKIAAVATKYLQACEMLTEIGVRQIDDVEQRRAFFTRHCTEEQARVYEATVHNLQSTYDTHVQNTVLEASDERLALLRGHASAALHLLEAVTHLTHFMERHEDETREDEFKDRIRQLISRDEVQVVTLNVLLHWANRYMQSGARVAEDLLPEYTNIQELEVRLPEHVALHARPAALVVGIVNHHGTPVEMQVEKQRCNAASILELLVLVGAHSDAELYTFRGDENPLQDIRRLFEHGLGEDGMETLPAELDYLRNQ